MLRWTAANVRATATVALFAVASPFSFWALNAPRGASPWGPLLVGSVAVGVGFILLSVLGRRLEPDRAAAVVSVFLLAAFNWRVFGDPLYELVESVPRDLAPIPAVLLVGFLVWRFSSRREVHLSLLVMGTVMVGSSLVSLGIWYSGEQALPPSSLFEPTPWEAPPGDVHVIVLDGYARDDVLDLLYGFDNSSFVAALERNGFVVPSEAHSNYTSTIASLSSALLGDYPQLTELRLTDRERVAAHAVLGGANPVIEAFRRSGYRYVHVEGGWIAGSCGSGVDECVGSTLLDEAMWALAERSALGWWFERSYGHAFSRNALRALEDLTALENGPLDGGRLILTHVILPHPPLLISNTCSIRFLPELTGDAIGHPSYSDDLMAARRLAYVEQVECVNSRILEFLEYVEEEDVVIMFGDHGPDSFGQLTMDPSLWTAEQIWERLAIFASIKLPGCPNSVPDDWSPVNGLRSAIRCLSGDQVSDVDDRMFIFPIDAAPGIVTEVAVEYAGRR